MAASGSVFRHYLCFAFCDHVAGTWSLTQKNYAPKVGIKMLVPRVCQCTLLCSLCLNKKKQGNILMKFTNSLLQNIT